MADQRGCSPLPGLVADRKTVGRPLPCWRADARPLFAPKDIAKQDQQNDDKALREFANPVARRTSSTGVADWDSTLDSAPNPYLREVEQTVARRSRHGRTDQALRAPVPRCLVHVDVKKLGNIPDGGGWRYVGHKQGDRNRSGTPDKPRNQYGGPKLGYAHVHTVIDDHSRVAYTEVHDDETAITAIGVLQRAVDWFAVRGVSIERVLSDNGGAYRSFLWRDTCEALSIRVKYTRPYRPQTNGRVERFHRTMADGWAYARCYRSEGERRDALKAWLHHYNEHRPHTACGNQPPFSRLINVPDQYI